MTKRTKSKNDIPWELQDAKDCQEPLSEDDSFAAIAIVCFITVFVTWAILWFS